MVSDIMFSVDSIGSVISCRHCKPDFKALNTTKLNLKLRKTFTPHVNENVVRW